MSLDRPIRFIRLLQTEHGQFNGFHSTCTDIVDFSIGVRAGGGEGGCSPPKYGQLRFFGQQEKIWVKPVFKDVSMFFIIIIILKRQIFSILTRSRRNNSVTFTRVSGCLARDEFLVIREGYHMLIFFLLGTVLHCTGWNGLFPVVK